MFGKRILVLVPHPDDEVVACSATIERARAEGAEIFALYITHGCIAQDAMWSWQRKNYDAGVARRRLEAELAAKLLGITPVGWMPRPARHVGRELPKVYDEIRDAIAAHNIDQLWVPAYEGGNADHDALNAVAGLLAGSFNKNRTNSSPLEGGRTRPLSVLEFAEYNYFGGKAESQSFPYPNGTETIIPLRPEEQNKKRMALALYKSEQKNLGYVKTERECYRPLADYDYSKPPHPGTLWYARFQWVPFRHPRVDFTRPEDVSAAISAFLTATSLPEFARR
jgi:LmbE family N-acetylglucosaminyl deacetylase